MSVLKLKAFVKMKGKTKSAVNVGGNFFILNQVTDVKQTLKALSNNRFKTLILQQLK